MYKAFGDIGFGWTKFIDSNGKRVLRPSVYSEMPIGLDGNETGIESPIGDFLFGDDVFRLSSMERRFQNYEDCLSDAYAASVLLAISEMNGKTPIDCELVLSLPFDGLYLQTDLIKRLTGTHEIKRLDYHKKQTINISFPSKYGVMPQNSAPAFVSLDLNHIKREGKIWLAVANIGSQTFEQGTFGFDLDSFALLAGTFSQQATETEGVYTLVNDIRPLLIKHFRGQKKSFSQYDIFKILISEIVEIGNREIDVSDIVRPRKQEYVETIHNYCQQLWSPQNRREIADMYQLCISGGGAYIVAPYLKETGFHNNIVVSDDPQFDVCIGSMNWHKLIGE